MSGTLGYDLERVVELRTQTIRAIAALDDLRSDDPAADAVDDLVAHLHRVLDDHWMTAVTEIIRSDPLAGPIVALPTMQVAARRLLGPSCALPPTAAGSSVRAPGDPGLSPARWSDDELMAELDVVATVLPYDDEFRPDFTDDLWETFGVLADEIARRAHDPAFADLLLARFPADPLVGLVARFAALPPGVVVALLSTTLESTSHVDDLASRYDAAAADALLASLIDEPAAALDLLGDRDRVHELLVWPLLDADTVAEVLLTGLLVPGADPSRLGDGHEVLRHLVAHANGTYVDRSRLSSPIATAMAAGLALYLPDFIASMEPGDQVNLRGVDDKNVGAPLGSSEEVLDLLGSILRDPNGAATLFAALGTAAGDVARGTANYDLADVGDFALALAAAAENERVEDEMHDAAVNSIIARAAVVVGLTAGVAVTATGVGPSARSILTGVIRNGANTAADRIADGATREPDDTSGAAEAAIEFAVFEAFLDDPTRYTASPDDLDPERVASARRTLDRVRQLVVDGAALATVERELQDVRVDVVALGGADFVAELDRGSIRLLDEVRHRVDLADPLN